MIVNLFDTSFLSRYVSKVTMASAAVDSPPPQLITTIEWDMMDKRKFFPLSMLSSFSGMFMKLLVLYFFRIISSLILNASSSMCSLSSNFNQNSIANSAKKRCVFRHDRCSYEDLQKRRTWSFVSRFLDFISEYIFLYKHFMKNKLFEQNNHFSICC